MASHLVLLGSPRELHVPYFAMAVPRSRESYVERPDLGTDLARLVGRRCAAWIKARADRDGIELIRSRNYLPPSTAFYATWLVFGDETAGSEFLDTYPQHRLEGRMAKIEADRAELVATLDHRLKRGDFNLGRIGNGRQRENLARHYVAASEHLRGFNSELKLLERASELRGRWQQELMNQNPAQVVRG